MKKTQLLMSAIISIFVLSGCASKAGPFVTSISSDGRGGLIVEKCMAKFDPWMSTVNNDNCTSTTMRIQ
ncbi:hypothetical protein AUR61_002760 [Stutzerimonas balearica]|jgi:outer membrane murein-binding lipoprotein Lpp|nr:hypothetical protein AUR61_002760 [Stutzerimonas balearica]